jgi:hypothetical protein
MESKACPSVSLVELGKLLGKAVEINENSAEKETKQYEICSLQLILPASFRIPNVQQG